MTEVNSIWLLTKLAASNTHFPVLDTGFCQGLKLTDYFYTDATGGLARNSNKLFDKSKYLLNHFLNISPLSGSICYVYFGGKLRLLSASEVKQLSKNYIENVSMNSIHLAVATQHKPHFIYAVTAQKDFESLQVDFELCSLSKAWREPVHDLPVKEQALALTKQVLRAVKQELNKAVKTLQYDLVIDKSGELRIIKVTHLVLQEVFRSPKLVMASMFEESEISSSDEKEKHGEAEEPKPQFLQMIANTIDKQRKKENQLTLRGREEFKRISYQMHRHLNSMNDLLEYIKKTRAKTWLKDSPQYSARRKVKPMNAPPRRQMYSPLLNVRSPLAFLDNYCEDAKRRKSRRFMSPAV